MRVLQQHEGEVVSATGMGVLINHLSYQVVAPALNLPVWLTQILLTVFIACLTLIITHFLKRELNRRWPEKMSDKS